MLELVEGSVQSSLLTFLCLQYLCGSCQKANKNALTAALALSLACLEIRLRNEEAINSTRNRIYSLKVVYFLLYRRRYFLFVNWFSSRVGEDRKYVCGRRIYACINTRKFKGLDSREIASLSGIINWFTWHVISIIAENKPHAHHRTHLRAMKVYNTLPS